MEALLYDILKSIESLGMETPNIGTPGDLSSVHIPVKILEKPWICGARCHIKSYFLPLLRIQVTKHPCGMVSYEVHFHQIEPTKSMQ